MFKTWIRGAATALGMVGVSWHATADTSNYQVYTNSAGDIYLKAPEQFVLIHADVSVPLHVMPADGYLKVLRNSDGSWTTTAISAAEWNSLGLFQGGNTVDSLRYQDMNGDGTLDMFVRLSDGRYLIIYREKNGQFKTTGSGDVKIGASYELKDVNGDGYIDVVSGGTVVSYGLPQYRAIYSNKYARVQQADHVGMTAGSFRVDEGGQVSYSIPLDIPAGIAGVQPQVSLNYNSGGGPGLAGMGWSLTGTSMISRCGKTIVQDNVNQAPQYNSNDAYCLDGQRLMLISGSYGQLGSTYRLEVDDFSRITITAADTNSGPTQFKLVNKANETHMFGGGNSTQVTPGKTVASGWGIASISDSFGNAITFDYYPRGADGASPGNFLLKDITYAGGTAKVVPVYQTLKTPKAVYMNGQEVVFKYRLDYVKVLGDVNRSEYVHRFYHLGYQDNVFNYLNTVQECLAEGTVVEGDTLGSNCKKAVKFTYEEVTPTTVNSTASSGTQIPSDTPMSSSFADFNGDGVLDNLYIKDTSVISVLAGTTAKTDILTAKLNTAINPNFSIQDVNGDGLPDVLYVTGDLWVYKTYGPWGKTVTTCPGKKATECFDRTVDKSYSTEKATGISGYTKPLFADVNGDGLIDWLVVADRSVSAYLNLGGTFDSKLTSLSSFDTSLWPKPASSTAADIRYSLSIVGENLLDVNGDGNSDLIARLSTSYVENPRCAYPASPTPPCNRAESVLVTLRNKGKLDGNLFEMLSMPQLPESNLRFNDINSDGLTDLVFYKDNIWLVSFATGGDAKVFNEPTAIQSLGSITPNYYNHKLFNFMDVNADGVVDLIQPAKKQWRNTNRYVEQLVVQFGALDTAGRWSLSPITIDLPVYTAVDKTLNNDSVVTQWTDADSDGDLDFVFSTGGGWQVHKVNAVDNKAVHKIVAITNGFGGKTEVSYGDSINRNLYTPHQLVIADGSANPDYFAPQFGQKLVQRVRTSTGLSLHKVVEYDPETNSTNESEELSEDWLSVSYEYAGFLLHKKGRGSLGFNKLTTVDDQTGIRTTTTYSQEWPFVGRPLSTVVLAKDGKQISEAKSTWNKKTVADNGLFVYLEKSEEQGSQIQSDGTVVPIKKVVTTNEYDQNATDNTAWGNLTKSTVQQYGVNKTTETLLLTTTTANIYDGWTSTYSKRFGRLSQAAVTQKQEAITNVQDADTQTRVSNFTYNSTTGLLETEELAANCKAVEPSTGQQPAAACDKTNWKKTTYKYNGAGLKTQTAIETTYGVRYASVAYSSDNRYVLSKSDAAENDSTANVETYLYNGTTNPQGRITEMAVTGPNKQISVSRFNLWGEAVESIDATGIVSSSWLENCANSSLAAYCQSTDEFISRSSRQGTPEQAQITDKWGRVSKKLAKGFDGNWKQTAVAYDSQGRVAKEYQAEPASSKASSLSTSFTYDSYGRLVKTTHPDGASVAVSYKGLTTSTQDEAGYWRDEVKDALGRTVYTSDPYAVAGTANLGGVRQWFDAFGNNVKTQVFAPVDSNGKPAVGTNASKVGLLLEETAIFDLYGRRSSSTSPSKGTWHYRYNGFNELVSQVDGRSRPVSNQYDRWGRLQESNSDDGKVCYSYGTDANKRNKGKLIEIRRFAAAVSCATNDAAPYRESYTFDELGRPSMTETWQNGKLFQQMAYYDAEGRPFEQILPGGVKVTQKFNSVGFQTETYADGVKIAEILAMDDAGRVTKASFIGDAKRTVSYDNNRGFIKNITVTGAGSKPLFTVDYGYNSRGDTKTRNATYQNGNATSSINETYTYSGDGHFRLENRQLDVTNPQTLGNLVTSMSQSFSYDSLGNLKTKSGVGTYTYDSTNPYRLVSTSGASAGVRSYAIGSAGYDAHGNITNDGQRSFKYNQADMPTQIVKGSDTTTFDYAPDNSRIYREDKRGTEVTKTWYLGKVYEVAEKAGTTEERWYLGNVVLSKSSKNSELNYEVLHSDSQGSTVTVTDGKGALVSHSLYDAWGQQSSIFVGSTSQLFVQSLQRRGYTGHENVDGMGIIHMNGRIYDPLLARFVQADPTLQFAQYTQGYNRYAYVLNNPMTYTDPSGYLLKWVMKATGIGHLLRAIASVPLLGSMIAIGLNFIPGCQGGWCTAVYQGLKTYAVTGSLGAGLRAGVFAAAAPGGADFGNAALNFIADGVAGGVFSVLQGGKFGHGFISSAVGNQMAGAGGNNPYMRVAVSAMVGGTISAVTGGKFLNGAASAAFATALREYNDGAFGSSQNEESDDHEDPTDVDDRVNRNPNLKLSVSEDGNTLSGEIKIYCPNISADACKGVAKKMSLINGTSHGKTINLNITAADGPFATFKADLTYRDDPTLGANGEGSFSAIRINSEKANKYTYAHELGHSIGLNHQLKSDKTLMSYSKFRTNQLGEQQIKNLFNAYSGD